jgi:cytoskeletal protein CcmA (bactofilin family)
MKKLVTIVSIFILSCFITAGQVSAVSFFEGEVVRVDKGRTIEGSVFAVGEAVEVNGTINGDLYCAAGKVRINGTINGDVLCAGQSLTITGVVNGNVRATGQMLALSGTVARNVLFLGQTVQTSDSTRVRGELITAGQTMNVDGAVGKGVFFAGEQLDVEGIVGGNVTAFLERLQFSEQANVRGNVSYTSDKEALFGQGATVEGKLTKHAPQIEADKETAQSARNVWFSSLLFFAASSIAVGLLLLLLWSKHLGSVIDVMAAHPLASIGWGVILMLVMPIVAAILCLTVVGIPAGVILLLLWIMLFLVSGAVASIAVGDKVLSAFIKDYERSMIWALIVGSVVLGMVCSVPFIGWLVWLIATWWAMGGLFGNLRQS